MLSRRRGWCLVIASIGLIAAICLEPTHCVRGWLRGEAFYDGRPTSFWRGVVIDSLSIDWPNFPKNISWIDRVKGRLGIEPRYTSFHLLCDTDADPVLRELVQDDDPHVAAFAFDVLNGPRGLSQKAKQIGYPTWIHLLKKHNRR